jgi:PIN domain nuclease of toxin-antitoxin system
MTRQTRSGAAVSAGHLLDTRTLLWALAAPERLSARARRLIDAGENVVSVASYWEVVIKTQKGLLGVAPLTIITLAGVTAVLARRALPAHPGHPVRGGH